MDTTHGSRLIPSFLIYIDADTVFNVLAPLFRDLILLLIIGIIIIYRYEYAYEYEYC